MNCELRAIVMHHARNNSVVSRHTISLVADDEQNRKGALDKLRTQVVEKAKHVVLAFHHKKILMKSLTVDAVLTSEQVLHYLTQQSPHLFGHAHDDIALDYETLHLDNKTSTLRVVTARKAIIQPWLDVFDESKFKLKAIDAQVLALTRATNQFTTPKGCVALTYWVGSTLLFCVIEAGELITAYLTEVDHPKDVESSLRRAMQCCQAHADFSRIQRTVVAGTSTLIPICKKVITHKLSLPVRTASESHLTAYGLALWTHHHEH